MARVSEAEMAERRALEQITSIGVKINANKEINDWAAVLSTYGLPSLPDNITSIPFDRRVLYSFFNPPRFGRERISPFAKAVWAHQKAQLENGTDNLIKLSPLNALKDRPEFGKLRLTPDQQPVANEILRRVREYLDAPDDHQNRPRMVLQDGVTGSGKTYVAAYVMSQLLGNHILTRHKPLPFFHILTLTTKSVQPTYRKVLIQAGLGPYITKSPMVPAQAMINTYPELTTGLGRLLYYDLNEEMDIITDEVIESIKWKDTSVPLVLILDETQHLIHKKSKRTRIIQELFNLPFPPFTIHFSATPFIRVNDAQTICLSAGNLSVNGIKVTDENWNQAMAMITTSPDKPSRIAAKRLKAVLAPYTVSFPRVKWASRAINRIKLIDFETPQDKILHDRAMEDWLEAVQKMGKTPTSDARMLAMIALGQFRKRAEPLRINSLVDEMVNRHANNNTAPVLFCAYRRSIEKALIRLVDHHGVDRNKISLIWGGRRKFREDLLMSEDESEELSNKILEGDFTTEDIRRLKETIKFQSDAIDRGFCDEEGVIDMAAQSEMQARLSQLGLTGNQSRIARQRNIENFQEGNTEFCLVTIQAGGTGLSLDKWKPALRDRQAFLSPIYNGREFIQALGRLVRRMTIQPEVFQDIYILRNSIEEEHVAPTLDKALAAAYVAAPTFNEMAIMKHILADQRSRIRTEAEVMEDSMKDESQLTYIEEESDEDDED